MPKWCWCSLKRCLQRPRGRGSEDPTASTHRLAGPKPRGRAPPRGPSTQTLACRAPSSKSFAPPTCAFSLLQLLLPPCAHARGDQPTRVGCAALRKFRGGQPDDPPRPHDPCRMLPAPPHPVPSRGQPGASLPQPPRQPPAVCVQPLPPYLHGAAPPKHPLPSPPTSAGLEASPPRSATSPALLPCAAASPAQRGAGPPALAPAKPSAHAGHPSPLAASASLPPRATTSHARDCAEQPAAPPPPPICPAQPLPSAVSPAPTQSVPPRPSPAACCALPPCANPAPHLPCACAPPPARPNGAAPA
mmetsp:Transcript_21695/g.54704  ORF Transcript_21695/g.54704 Transcript_21695/m.54704 type:complete len:303 (-) Transcript_21695:320-1228(-)